jgi:uncharacterized protein YkwD
MNNACIDHVVDTGPSGTTGDTGADGSSPSDRVNRYGTADPTPLQTNIYGRIRATEIVYRMLIDDGNPSRQNRFNILNPNNLAFGLYSGTISGLGH